MKGLLLLTEARSGSSWLSNAARRTGVLGKCGEWLDPRILGVNAKQINGEDYTRTVLERASTDNGVFYVKIFPRHLHWFQLQFGFDFINHLAVDHDLLLVTLTRQDRLRQAISFAKGLQSKAWSDRMAIQNNNKAKVKYDFAQICRTYFMIERSYNYWESYLSVQDLEHKAFVYEELTADPNPFLHALAAHAGVNDILPFQSETKIQRNAETEEWHARFKEDVRSQDFVDHTTPARPHARTLLNLGQFLSGRQMKSFPFDY